MRESEERGGGGSPNMSYLDRIRLRQGRDTLPVDTPASSQSGGLSPMGRLRDLVSNESNPSRSRATSLTVPSPAGSGRRRSSGRSPSPMRQYATTETSQTLLQKASIHGRYRTPEPKPSTTPRPRPKSPEDDTSSPPSLVVPPPPTSLHHPPSLVVPPPPTFKDEMFDVNTAIERTGWGRYQHKVVFVMGIMSFADAAEVWLATIILNNLKCEWGLSSLEKALIPAIVYFFYAIGSTISGKLADKLGRLPVLLVNGYLLVVSAVASAFAPGYYYFLCCRAVTGFCIGGSYGCSIVYSAEMMPANRRSWNMCILEIYWIMGSVYECAVAFFVMDLESGWRIQILLTALPCAIMLVLLHFMDESPRYLVIHDQREKAVRVIEKICGENKVEVPDGTLYCSDVRSGEYGEIWAAPHTSGSVQISVHFVANMFLVFGVTMLVADMMSYNYCYMELFFTSTYVNVWGCSVYTKAEYLYLMVVAISFAPGMLLGTIGAETVGRRWTFIVSIYVGAIFTVLLLFCLNSILTYVEVFGAIICYAAYNEVLWIYGPEFYPTYMRGTAIGVQNGLGKLGAAAGTFLTEYLDEYSISYTLYCFVVVQAVACVTILFMKRETRGEQLVDTRLNEQTYINQHHQ